MKKLLISTLITTTLIISSGISLAGDVVKKSRTGICHAPGSTYYAKTKNYIPFPSLEDCLRSGGRLPKR